MATLVSAPKGAPKVPEFKMGQRFDDLVAEEDAYFDELKRFLILRRGVESVHRVGEVISYPIADGYAIYVIVQTKPLQIMHVPIGDAWNAPAAWIRGLRLSDM